MKQQLEKTRLPISDHHSPGEKRVEEHEEFSLPMQYFPRHRDLLYRPPSDYSTFSSRRNL